jgi:CheY-like chemotaxis protein
MRLRQVLINLLGNAAKFTDSGSIELSVARCTEGEREDDLLFQVRDTGIGIPGDKQERIFEAFHQADSTTTRRYGGTGLGLAIARRLVELMKGRIWVESEPGRGSSFYFTAHLPASQRTPETGLPIPRGLKVLLVEDNPVNQKLAETLLRRRNHAVAIAANGLEAVSKFRDGDFDLILMDVQMPEMDGLEATRAIREIERQRGGRIRIVAMTAFDQEGDRQRCLDAGMDGFLGKPIDARQLLAAIMAPQSAGR